MRRAAHRDADGDDAGFTIIEVLVAIAVVAVVLTSIGAVMATSTRGVRALEQHVVMMETARSVAASLRSREPLTDGGLSGELYGNRWRIDATPLGDTGVALQPQSPWLPQVLTIRVQSPTGAVYSLKTVRLQELKRQ